MCGLPDWGEKRNLHAVGSGQSVPAPPVCSCASLEGSQHGPGARRALNGPDARWWPALGPAFPEAELSCLRVELRSAAVACWGPTGKGLWCRSLRGRLGSPFCSDGSALPLEEPGRLQPDSVPASAPGKARCQLRAPALMSRLSLSFFLSPFQPPTHHPALVGCV